MGEGTEIFNTLITTQQHNNSAPSPVLSLTNYLTSSSGRYPAVRLHRHVKGLQEAHRQQVAAVG